MVLARGYAMVHHRLALVIEGDTCWAVFISSKENLVDKPFFFSQDFSFFYIVVMLTTCFLKPFSR